MTPLPILFAQIASLDTLHFDLRAIPPSHATPCGAGAAEEIVVCGRSASRYRIGALPDLASDPVPAIKLPGGARIQPGARKGTGVSLVIPF